MMGDLMKVIAATGNKGKVMEIKKILGDGFDVVSMKEAGCFIDVEETGTTFEENALIKAESIAKYISENNILDEFCVIADDSGLCVDYLNGAPGIYSARFAGEGATDEDKYNKLLSLLEGVTPDKRKARFVCCAAAVFGGGAELHVLGECEGIITDAPQGEGGFGYDPVFYLKQFGRTMAEVSTEQKNEVSHRGIAFRKLAEKITEHLANKEST